MLLREWLPKSSFDIPKLAQKLEVDPISVGRYINGRRMPLPEIISKIATITNGDVTHSDLYAAVLIAKEEDRKKRGVNAKKKKSGVPHAVR